MSYFKMTLISWLISFVAVSFILISSTMAESNLFAKPDILAELKQHGELAESAETLSVNGISIQEFTIPYEGLYALYNYYKENSQPIFITTDLVFHSVHKIFDYSLRIKEIEQLPLLKQFSEKMFKAASALKEELGTNKELAPAVDQVIAYFAVPNLLLGNKIDIKAPLKAQIDAEIRLIQEHKGFDFSKILRQKEDYSQYIPRGHYTRNESLKKYFLGSIWYGRRMFRFDESKPGGAGEPVDTPDIKGWWNKADEKELHEIAHSEIISACLVVYLLEHTNIDSESGMAVCQKLKAPFDFLVGISEDITVEKLSEALVKTYRKDWKPSDLLQQKKLYEMAKGLAKSNLVEIDATGLGRKGLTLLGQRFILDSKFFQKLVHDEENPIPYNKKDSKGEKPFTWAEDPVAGEVRGFPRGLDIMAIFGSVLAEEMLKTAGDTDYVGYDTNKSHLKKELEVIAPSNNIYEKILRSFALLFGTEENAPAFMQTKIWKKKSLNTALGAWTELRHDTVLYGKQSYSSVSRGITLPPKNGAYLEPTPKVYHRLGMILSELKESKLISHPDITKKYETLIKILRILVEISTKELKGEMPNIDETDFLFELASRFKKETTLSNEIAKKVGGETDSNMLIAVDVHTRMPEALTEAIGFPLKIIVVIPVKNKPRLFFGGVYSYYEFKAPYENRLTDEKWADQLKRGKIKYKPIIIKE